MTPHPVEVLAATKLFGGLDAAALDVLAGAAVPRRYDRGEYLFHRGERGDCLFVLARGRVKVTISSPDGVEAVLAALGPHDTVGELALLDGGQRSASVVAVEPTAAYVIGRRELMAAMGRHPAVLDAVLRGLGAMIRRLTDTTGDLVFLDLGGRLAKALLRLAAGSGTGVVDLGLTQSDLAAMVGASRQATNRALHLMAREGWISLDGTVIEVLDGAALRRRAGV